MYIDPNTHSQVGKCRGFTLIELVIGLAAMAFLAGTMFFIVQGSISAASEIEMIQKENRQMKRFVDLCRELFSTFPADATAELKIIETDPLVQELQLHNVSKAFVWGEEPVNDTATMTISPRKREERMDESKAPFFIGITRPDFFKEDFTEEGEDESLLTESVLAAEPLAEEAEVPMLTGMDTSVQMDEQGRYWMELVSKIGALSWRFYNAKDKRWEDKYDRIRPPLVELSYLPHNRKTPVRVVFPVR